MAKYQLAKQIETVNQHDADAFTAFYAPDATVTDPQYPGPLRGRDAIRQDIQAFLTAFPDLKFTIETVLEDGENVAFEGIAKGINSGTILSLAGDIPPTNKPMNMRFAGFLRVTNQGLISSERRYYDLAGMFEQLGLTEQTRQTA
jgi:steroid delta-isomerase-like uncharacterized protein